MSRKTKCKKIKKYLDSIGVYNGLDTKYFKLNNGQIISDKGRQAYQNMKKDLT